MQPYAEHDSLQMTLPLNSAPLLGRTEISAVEAFQFLILEQTRQ